MLLRTAQQASDTFKEYSALLKQTKKVLGRWRRKATQLLNGYVFVQDEEALNVGSNENESMEVISERVNQLQRESYACSLSFPCARSLNTAFGL